MSQIVKFLGRVEGAGVPSVQSFSERSGGVHFVRVGNRAINLDNVIHCEVQVWHDAITVKLYMVGVANNTPLVLNEEEAQHFWKYVEYVAEKPV